MGSFFVLTRGKALPKEMRAVGMEIKVVCAELEVLRAATEDVRTATEAVRARGKPYPARVLSLRHPIISSKFFRISTKFLIIPTELFIISTKLSGGECHCPCESGFRRSAVGICSCAMCTDSRADGIPCREVGNRRGPLLIYINGAAPVSAGVVFLYFGSHKKCNDGA